MSQDHIKNANIIRRIKELLSGSRARELGDRRAWAQADAVQTPKPAPGDFDGYAHEASQLNLQGTTEDLRAEDLKVLAARLGLGSAAVGAAGAGGYAAGKEASAPYIEGFTAKCAEYGVDPVELVESVKQGSSALNKMIRRSIAAGNRRPIEDSELWDLINRLSLRGDAGGAARGIQRKFHDIAQGVSHGKPSASRIESSQSSPALQALKSLGSPEDLQSLSPRITQ